MRPDYRLLFVDVDGTLSNSMSAISRGSIEALDAARAAGCEIVICTGRSLHTARAVLEQVHGDYAIVLNGAVVYARQTQSVVRLVTLSREATAVASACIRGAGLAPLCFGVEDDDRAVYTEPDAPLNARWGSINRERIRVAPSIPDGLPRLPIMVAAYDCDDRIAPVAEALQQALAGMALVIRSWAPVYACQCVEAHSTESGKDRAAQEVARLLGVPREQTFAIGDNHNDTGLIRWAGLGVAMGNSPPDVRDAADAVTGGLDEEGAAQAIRKYVLGENARP